MSEELLVEESTEEVHQSRWIHHKLALFVSGSIFIAFILVMVSMALYNSSGAAQLDISRPGYRSAQNKVDQSDNFESFPATGSVEKKTIDQFQKLYDKQTKQVGNSDAFSSSAMDDQVLGIDDPSVDQ